VSILSSAHSDLILVLTGGGGKNYRKIFNYAKELGILDRVKFLGYVPDADVMEIFKRAHALIYPSLFGPTNIPPLEAFALGCPVAVSNIYGMPEQCKDAALYFNPLDFHEIADVISRLWVDEELVEKISKKGLEASLEFTQTKFNERFKEIIFEALQLP
jgi:glycosyltransferase involved in cell wall biosynthesis